MAVTFIHIAILNQDFSAVWEERVVVSSVV